MTFQASVRTKKHMQTQPATSTPVAKAGMDPWLSADPWKHWAPSTVPDGEFSGQEVVFNDGHGTSSHLAKQKFEVLEQRLIEHVDQKLAAQAPPGLTAMETDENQCQRC